MSVLRQHFGNRIGFMALVSLPAAEIFQQNVEMISRLAHKAPQNCQAPSGRGRESAPCRRSGSGAFGSGSLLLIRAAKSTSGLRSCPIQPQLPKVRAQLREVPDLDALIVHTYSQLPAIGTQSQRNHVRRQGQDGLPGFPVAIGRVA